MKDQLMKLYTRGNDPDLIEYPNDEPNRVFSTAPRVLDLSDYLIRASTTKKDYS
jgi:hypothetical protein